MLARGGDAIPQPRSVEAGGPTSASKSLRPAWALRSPRGGQDAGSTAPSASPWMVVGTGRATPR